MASIHVQVNDDVIEVDLDPNAMTLTEHERLQKQIGNRRYTDFLQSGAIELLPDFLRALLYAKLKTQIPDLEPDDIDVGFADLLQRIGEMAEDREGKASESA